MKCPFCFHTTSRVTDKRATIRDTIRRRRECKKCKKRFTTYERADTLILVIKKDGRRERFDREKLLRGIQKACEKRKVSIEQINQAVRQVEAKIKLARGNEIKSKKIGEEVMKSLKKLDKVAYIRFASVYKDFTDAKDFQKELEGL